MDREINRGEDIKRGRPKDRKRVDRKLQGETDEIKSETENEWIYMYK